MATLEDLRKLKKKLSEGADVSIGNTKIVTVGKKGDKGDKGESGYTPVKGIDYFDGEDGKDGKDGYTPIKGVDYFDGKDGKDGKDGSPDTAEEIRNKLETLEGTARLDAKAIQNIEKYINSKVVYQGGNGAERFTKLKDTPKRYKGYSGRIVTVKDDESGLDFSLKVSVSDVEPSSPKLNDLWIDTSV